MIKRLARKRRVVEPGQGVKPRMRAFFESNPEEELTLQQTVAKFDTTYESVKSALRSLTSEGVLESVHVVRLRAKGIAR